MRISHIILVVLALIACAASCVFGFRSGTQQSPLKEDLKGRLAMNLHTYQLVEATNWSRVHSAVGIQLLAVTRGYERRFGVEAGTNRFALQFAEAKAIADAFEGQLVPIGSMLTNLPMAPDAKVRFTHER